MGVGMEEEVEFLSKFRTMNLLEGNIIHFKIGFYCINCCLMGQNMAIHRSLFEIPSLKLT